jgi:uncharacterized delta-60 repeat protein
MPDGKVVVVGSTYNGADLDFVVVRYNTDGSLDDTFGDHGIVTTGFGFGDDIAYAVAIQQDGKVVVVGTAYNGSNDDLAVARYDLTGGLDPSFGGDGSVLVAVGSSADEGHAVALMGDGRIVAAGRTDGGNWDVFVVRLNPGGALDPSFGGDGIVTTHFGVPSGDDEAFGVSLLSDGRIVVGGRTKNSSGDHDFALACYEENGTLDTGFGGGDGLTTTPIGSGTDEAYALVVQPDDRIVLAGRSLNASGDYDIALARYDDVGDLDEFFGSGGIVVTAVGGGDDEAYAITLQPDTSILVGGTTGATGDEDFFVARYDGTGTLDDAFGAGGIRQTDFGGTRDYGRAMAFSEASAVPQTYWFTSETTPLQYMMVTTPPSGSSSESTQDVVFYSDARPVGSRVYPGVSDVYLWVYVPAAGGEQTIQLALWAGSDATGWSYLGSTSWQLADLGVPVFASTLISTNPYTFGSGEGLRLDVDLPVGSTGTRVYWDGIYNDSRIEVP